MFLLGMTDANTGILLGIISGLVPTIALIVSHWIQSAKIAENTKITAEIKTTAVEQSKQLVHVTDLVNSADSRRDEEKKALTKEVGDLKNLLSEKKDLLNEANIVNTIRDALQKNIAVSAPNEDVKVPIPAPVPVVVANSQ